MRSGVLISVHAFATDPERGIFILAFLTVVIGGALLMYAWRAPRLKSAAGFEATSRESFVLFNNALLVTALSLILLGTLYPLFMDALELGKVSVGPPYFNLVFLVPMLPLLALLGVGMHAAWKRGMLGTMRTRLFAVAGSQRRRVGRDRCGGLRRGSADDHDRLRPRDLGHAVLAARPVRAPAQPPAAARGDDSAWSSPTSASGSRPSASPASNRSRSRRISRSGSATPRRSPVTNSSSRPCATCAAPTTWASKPTSSCRAGGEPVTVLKPQKRLYNSGGNALSEAGIEVGAARDLFAALGDDLGQGRWSFRLQYKPLIRFIWLGAILVAFGGLVAAFDRRYRLRVTAVARDRSGTGRAMKIPWRFLAAGDCASRCWSAFFAIGLQRDPNAIPSPLIGKPAPAFSLESLGDPGMESGHRGLRAARPGS